jgi:methionyl-tRNA formyltransferase
VETLSALGAGTISPRPQKGEPTFTRPLTRDHGRVDWGETASEIERRLRAFAPWPGLHTFLDGERIKLLDLDVAADGDPARGPGAIWSDGEGAKVAAGDGTAVRLLSVQRAGRRPVSGAELVRQIPPNARFE